MDKKDKQINEIYCEISGHPNVKWNKLKIMSEKFGFKNMKEKIKKIIKKYGKRNIVLI